MEKKFKIFYTTCEKKSDAKKIAKDLLLNKNAVCINIFNNVESFFCEDDSIKSSSEVVLIIKTHISKLKIERILRNIHPYETPIIVEIKVNKPNKRYLNWFINNSE
ncbi:MAG: hypothetical protein CMM95_00450 [Rickettsiales bacterium]|nr:hypothetical protein [Rickettsiales bacterium]